MNIYLYPNIKLDYSRSMNPYMIYLSESLSVHESVINKEHPASIGIFDILNYFKKLDIIYLNWVEDLPEKRGGYIQSFFFIVLFGFAKLAKKKIVWTLHNKKSHSNKYILVKSLLFNILLKYSNLIITHSAEGLQYIPESVPKFFIPHPLKSTDLFFTGNQRIIEKEYDVIIWGSITKYKGIDAFLLYLSENDLLHKYRILIAGKIIGQELQNTLEIIQQKHENVTLMNFYVEEKELNKLINKSKLILFCYHFDSVLSSGALMDSLLFNSIILGPDVGAFKDLRNEDLIYTFQDFKDLVLIIDCIFEDYFAAKKSDRKLVEFIEKNNWNTFADKISDLLQQL